MIITLANLGSSAIEHHPAPYFYFNRFWGLVYLVKVVTSEVERSQTFHFRFLNRRKNPPLKLNIKTFLDFRFFKNFWGQSWV